MMDERGTTAIAILCGKISGVMEAIDVDVKNWPGIDARLAAAIRDIYPEVYSRLRTHKTPSGGWHLIYRYILPEGAPIDGNKKLATSLDGDKAGIETRGEGGYIVAPPSLGYTLMHPRPIPTITYEERNGLIALCKSFNEKIKVEKPYNISKYESNYYDENPFSHYNNSPAGESVLIDNGWIVEGRNNTHIYYTRPGKDSGISASFDLRTRIFYLFTTSTTFEADKGYHPSTALAILQFGGDKKKAYAYLVQNGYGKVKQHIEQRAVRSAAAKGKPLPANFSQEAGAAYIDTRGQLQEKYPYGIYWVEDAEDSTVKISREKLYLVSEGLGFRLSSAGAVQIVGYTLNKINSRFYFDTIKAYIKEEDGDLYEAIFNAWEAFVQRSGEFTISRLPIIEPASIVSSTKTSSYKFFDNCFVKIEADRITEHSYDSLGEKKVWADQIQPRPWAPLVDEDTQHSLYYQFLDLAVGMDKQGDVLLKAIGYLAHDFKDETMGYIITLTEQCPDPKQGGGSGKNIFTSLLGHTTTLKNIPGSQVQYNEKFLQAWNFERILSISDVPKKFDFMFLKELSTGSGILKKLFRDEITVLPGQMPKLAVSTNYSYDVADGGLRRRIIPIEFTNFFTRAGGVDVHFGRMFPGDWNENEWLCFDNIVARGVQMWLAAGKLLPPELTAGGWQKQFDQNHGGSLTRMFIEESLPTWCHAANVKNEDIRAQYMKYLNENGANIKYSLSSPGLSKAIEEFCHRGGYTYIADHRFREMGMQFRGKHFELPAAPF